MQSTRYSLLHIGYRQEVKRKLQFTELVKKSNMDAGKMMGIFEKVFFFISFLYFSLNNKDQHKINERSFSE